MSQRYKAPRRAAGSSEQSQRSRPGRLGWRDCCQFEKQNYTALIACSFVFFCGVPSRLSSFSFWNFAQNFLDKEIFDFLKTALWASQASLCTQVSVFKVFQSVVIDEQQLTDGCWIHTLTPRHLSSRPDSIHYLVTFQEVTLTH